MALRYNENIMGTVTIAQQERTMTQKEIIRHFNEIGGLRCKDWTLQEIREYIHENIPACKRVLTTTCRELKRTAEMYQR